MTKPVMAAINPGQMKETTKGKILQEMVRDFHLVHGPGRHSLFLRPGHDLRSSLLHPKRQCRRSASLLFWVKFIYTPGVSSSCDMVGMCTGISFAFCSPGSPSLFPLRTCSSPPLMPHLIQYPGYHGDMIIRASIALGPSEGASLMHTHYSK